MKLFLGILAVLVVLAVAVLGILAIWGIYPVSFDTIWKSSATLAIGLASLALLALVITLFFRKEKYKNTGNKAHPIN